MVSGQKFENRPTGDYSVRAGSRWNGQTRQLPRAFIYLMKKIVGNAIIFDVLNLVKVYQFFLTFVRF